MVQGPIEDFIAKLKTLESIDKTGALFDALDQLIGQTELTSLVTKRLAVARFLKFLPKLNSALQKLSAGLDPEVRSTAGITAMLAEIQIETCVQTDRLATAQRELTQLSEETARLESARSDLDEKIGLRKETEQKIENTQSNLYQLEIGLAELTAELKKLNADFDANTRRMYSDALQRFNAVQSNFLAQFEAFEGLLTETQENLSLQLDDDKQILDNMEQAQAYEPGTISVLIKEVAGIRDQIKSVEAKLRNTVLERETRIPI